MTERKTSFIREVLSVVLESLNLLCESLGYGLKWEYYKMEVKIWDNHKGDYDGRTIKLICRRNVYSNNHYYRTMRPMCNGYDSNEWVRFNGKGFRLEMH